MVHLVFLLLRSLLFEMVMFISHNIVDELNISRPAVVAMGVFISDFL